MIDHLSLGTTQFARAIPFYRDVLAPLGFELVRDTADEAAFGTPERWSFFLYPAPAGANVTGERTHVALAAPTREAVRAAHETALRAGGRDIFTPRERPDISATYFGAMFHDLDGHRIEVVTNVL
jgi:catechol 2,3-dioxygenase-like lactoylglutathione lyase family enzyme